MYSHTHTHIYIFLWKNGPRNQWIIFFGPYFEPFKKRWKLFSSGHQPYNGVIKWYLLIIIRITIEKSRIDFILKGDNQWYFSFKVFFSIWKNEVLWKINRRRRKKLVGLVEFPPTTPDGIWYAVCLCYSISHKQTIEYEEDEGIYKVKIPGQWKKIKIKICTLCMHTCAHQNTDEIFQTWRQTTTTIKKIKRGPKRSTMKKPVVEIKIKVRRKKINRWNVLVPIFNVLQ